jgi:nicotinamide riboside kinase
VPPLPDPAPTGGLIIALLGAESTGKSTLAPALAAALANITGWSCTWVPETLRTWCDREQRTPRREEQAGIAAEQARQINMAAQCHELVVADTTPLMTAVYHHTVFGDDSLDRDTLRWQRHCAMTLVTALDLPWTADGLQRDGDHVREPVDSRLRDLLLRSGLAFTMVSGWHDDRLQAALNAVTPCLQHRPAPRPGLLTRLSERQAKQPTWRTLCQDCDDPGCEHALWQRARDSRAAP